MDTKAKQRVVIVVILLLWAGSLVFTNDIPVDGPYVALILLLSALQLGAMLWVYRDVKKRGADNPIVWVYAIIVPVIGLIGFIAYLISRPTSSKK